MPRGCEQTLPGIQIAFLPLNACKNRPVLEPSQTTDHWFCSCGVFLIHGSKEPNSERILPKTARKSYSWVNMSEHFTWQLPPQGTFRNHPPYPIMHLHLFTAAKVKRVPSDPLSVPATGNNRYTNWMIHRCHKRTHHTFCFWSLWALQYLVPLQFISPRFETVKSWMILSYKGWSCRKYLKTILKS